jgi:signal transduction histidine kinase
MCPPPLAATLDGMNATQIAAPVAGSRVPSPARRSIRPVAGPARLERPARRPEVQLPPGARWAVFGAFAAFVVVGLAVRLPDRAALAAAAAAAALAAGAAMTRVRPSLLAPLAAVAAAGVAAICSPVPSNVGWFAVCVLGGWCAFAGPPPAAVAFWVAAVALFGAEQLWGSSDPGWAAWALGTTCTVGAALLVRRERGLVAELRAAQAGLADRARSEERNRIARELHDVIAHSLTVSLLHVSGARMAVRYDPADAERALAEAERLGRETLDEVRSTVGLLRADADAAPGDGSAAPLPGIAGLPALAERFRTAGADVTLTLDGDPGGVPATVGLAVYRIVQEALTNAAKHAPGAAVSAAVTVADRVTVAVVSAGRPRSGRGLGLDSMRERAESLGGTLTAGPDGAGWAVRAVLPLPAGRDRGDRR